MIRVTGLLSVTALLLGCAGGGLPVTHYYTLRPPATVAQPDTAATGASVGVRPIAVDPPYDQDRLVYRKGRDGSEVGFYAYHRWASPLGRMIAVALADGLRAAPGVGSIEPIRSRGQYTALLVGRLRYLEQVDSASGQEVRIALDLELRDPQNQLLWSSPLAATASGAASEVTEVVDLARQAFDDVVEQARRQVAAHLSNVDTER